YDARLCDERVAVPFLTTLQAWLEGGFAAEAHMVTAPSASDWTLPLAATPTVHNKSQRSR
ncbi:MAG: hypothetical protein LC748_15840, partial [Thermomicrobia bacterium]|nr:hypothetical protein [Thermomicrobia bacterium]